VTEKDKKKNRGGGTKREGASRKARENKRSTVRCISRVETHKKLPTTVKHTAINKSGARNRPKGRIDKGKSGRLKAVRRVATGETKAELGKKRARKAGGGKKKGSRKTQIRHD